MKVHVVHGSVKVGGQWYSNGQAVEIPDAELQHLDPKGEKFLSPEKFEALKAKEKAEAVLAAPTPKAAPSPAQKGVK